jgi:hypothetical protein
MEQISLSTPIPTGAWTLYFHSPGEKKWTPETFHKLDTITTVGNFISVIDAIDDSKWSRGMYFWMRGQIPPLWENFQNIRGGSYSICQGTRDSIDIFHRYTIACMFEVATQKDDLIQGITISPKKGFHVIKIWNRDAGLFNKAAGLHLIDPRVLNSEIRYSPHVEKKM